VLVHRRPIVQQKLHIPHTQGITDWLSPRNGKNKKRWQNDKRKHGRVKPHTYESMLLFKKFLKGRGIPFRVHLPTHFSESLPSKLSNFNTNNWIPAIYFQVWNKGETVLLSCWVVCFDGHILLENWEVPSVPSFFFGLPPYSSPYSSRWYFVLCLCFWCQLAHKCLNPKSPNPIQWTWTSQVSMSYGTNHHIPHSTKWLKKIWISAC
jgi:hypothetical protein